jgi:hypothetical protein
MAAKTLTKEQWAQIEKSLSHPWGAARLTVDGYDVKLEVRRVSQRTMKYEIAVFIGGDIKGQWIMRDCDERRRFYRPVVTKVHNKKQRESLLKIPKKTLAKWAKENKNFDPDATFIIYSPTWLTFAPLRRHLEANNDSIELVEG